MRERLLYTAYEVLVFYGVVDLFLLRDVVVGRSWSVSSEGAQLLGVLAVAAVGAMVAWSRRSAQRVAWKTSLFGLWLLLVLAAHVLMGLVLRLTPGERVLFLLLSLFPYLPLRARNLGEARYQVSLVLRSGVMLLWAPWVAFLVARRWELDHLPGFLSALLSWAVLFVMAVLVLWFEFGVDGRKMAEAPIVRMGRRWVLEAVPYLALGVFLCANYLLWRDLLMARLLVAAELGIEAFLWAGIAFLYVAVLFGFPVIRHFVGGLKAPLFLVWVILVGAYGGALPFVLETSGTWSKLALAVIAVIPVIPLRPCHLRLNSYRTGLIWRSLAVPYWSLWPGYLLAREVVSPLEWFLGIGLMAGMLVFLWVAEYCVRWEASEPIVALWKVPRGEAAM